MKTTIVDLSNLLGRHEGQATLQRPDGEREHAIHYNWPPGLFTQDHPVVARPGAVGGRNYLCKVPWDQQEGAIDTDKGVHLEGELPGGGPTHLLNNVPGSSWKFKSLDPLGDPLHRDEHGPSLAN